MKDSPRNTKPTLEGLLKESQVFTEKDLIKRKEVKEKGLALPQEDLEFEVRYKRPKTIK